MGDVEDDPFADIPLTGADALPELESQTATTGWAALSFAQQLTSDKLGSAAFWFSKNPPDDAFTEVRAKADPRVLVPEKHRPFLGTVNTIRDLAVLCDVHEPGFPASSRYFCYFQSRTGIIFTALSAWENSISESSTSLPSEAARKALAPFLQHLKQFPAPKEGGPRYAHFMNEIVTAREHVIKALGVVLKSKSAAELKNLTGDHQLTVDTPMLHRKLLTVALNEETRDWTRYLAGDTAPDGATANTARKVQLLSTGILLSALLFKPYGMALPKSSPSFAKADTHVLLLPPWMVFLLNEVSALTGTAATPCFLRLRQACQSIMALGSRHHMLRIRGLAGSESLEGTIARLLQEAATSALANFGSLSASIASAIMGFFGRSRISNSSFYNRVQWTTQDHRLASEWSALMADHPDHSFPNSVAYWPKWDSTVVFRDDYCTLMLGTQRTALDIPELKAHQVDIIVTLNASSRFRESYDTDADCSDVRISRNDQGFHDVVSNLARTWIRMIDEIEGQECSRTKPMVILFHCLAGINRSTSALCAYLIVRYHLTAQQAIAILLSARPGQRYWQERDQFPLALHWLSRECKKSVLGYLCMACGDAFRPTPDDDPQDMDDFDE